MTKLEIYFHDLTEEAQQRVLKALGISSPEEASLDVFPLFVIELEVAE